MGVSLLVSQTGCTTMKAVRLADRGSAAIDRGDTQAAISDLETAVQLMPESAAIVNNLGVAYLAAGRKNAALAAFERAVVLDCDHEPAQRNLKALRDDPAAIASGAADGQ